MLAHRKNTILLIIGAVFILVFVQFGLESFGSSGDYLDDFSFGPCSITTGERFMAHRSIPVKARYSQEYRYFASVCAIMKEESNYLQEFLEHYFLLGFEHIYVVLDEDSTDEQATLDILKYYIENEMVSFYKFKLTQQANQHTMQSNCLRYDNNNSKWMAFPDFDALLTPINISETIRDALNGVEEHALYIQQKVMAANGQVEERLKIPIGSRFTEILHPQSIGYFMGYPFMLVQPKYVEAVHTHDAVLWNRSHTARSFCDTGVDRFEHKLEAPCYEKLLYYHYFSKSFEEYEKKCARGDNGRPNAIKLPKDYVRVKYNNSFASIPHHDRMRLGSQWGGLQVDEVLYGMGRFYPMVPPRDTSNSNSTFLKYKQHHTECDYTVPLFRANRLSIVDPLFNSRACGIICQFYITYFVRWRYERNI